MTEEKIERFFNKNCTPQEARQVAAYLNDHPEILDKYLSAKEWEQTGSHEMDNEFWEKIWLEMQTNKKAGHKTIWLKRAAAAALIIFVVGAGYTLMNSGKQQHAIAPVAKQAPAPEQKVRVNYSNEPISIDLPDSSTAILSPGSVLTYMVPLDKNKRDFQLEGKARFKVKKDKTRPFTVFAGDLATTALSTEFTINTKATGNKNVNVQLHSGKVVIKQTGHISEKWKDVYLVAGQQLSYSNAEMTAAVTTIKENGNKNNLTRKSGDVRSRKFIAGNDELSFMNSPLPDVLTKIEEYFTTNIVYDSADISRMNFTGTISRKDSLPIVLKVIAQMNELDIQQDENTFTLRKLK